MDDTELLRDAEGDVRGPGDLSEADWFPGVDGQRVDHPEVIPVLAVNHCCGDARERALEGPDEVLDCLPARGPGQGG
jgi:hypothetical protein